MEPTWVFDFPTASGSQSGGSAAEYGFSGRIDTLVRETIQNSMDAVLDPDQPVEVTYRLIELSGEKLDDFKASIGWERLAEHLESVPEERGGEGILQALKKLRNGRDIEDADGSVTFTSDPVIRILVIEDRNTKGLEGNEERRSAEERNPYRSLVFDELYSDKYNSSAGGSFGLGKVVLWAFSELNTVFFSSVPASPPDEQSGLRLVARASLPAHWTDADEFTGKGWFGLEREARHGLKRAHSVWGESASRNADCVYCPRGDHEYGTSIAIVGFSEPGYGDRSLDVLGKEIASSILESFWPAMIMDQLQARVLIESNGELRSDVHVNPARSSDLAPVCELYNRFTAGMLSNVERLDQAGDCGLRYVKLDVPERMSPEDETHEAFSVDQPILVQLLNEATANDAIRDRVFRFRKQGMLIGRAQGSNLSITARPYVAILPVGLAADGSDRHEQAEKFLRDAEPPAHDRWSHDTKALKAHYKVWGLKAALERFENEIRVNIRQLVSIPERRGGAIPEHIQKMLRFGNVGGGGDDQFLSMTRSKADPCAEGWWFSFRCRRIIEQEEPWVVRVRLFLIADGGKSENSKAIATVNCKDAETSYVEDGDAFIQLPSGAERVDIEGVTDPGKMSSAARRAGIQLKVDGWKGRLDNA